MCHPIKQAGNTYACVQACVIVAMWLIGWITKQMEKSRSARFSLCTGAGSSMTHAGCDTVWDFPWWLLAGLVTGFVDRDTSDFNLIRLETELRDSQTQTLFISLYIAALISLVKSRDTLHMRHHWHFTHRVNDNSCSWRRWEKCSFIRLDNEQIKRCIRWIMRELCA